MAFGIGQVLTNLGKAVITNRIKGSGSEPVYIGVGTGATSAARTAAVTDTALSTPVESRVAGTSTQVTTTTTNDTYQVVGTISLTANRTLDEAGLFDASTAGNLCVSATFTGIPINAGDSIIPTFKIQLS